MRTALEQLIDADERSIDSLYEEWWSGMQPAPDGDRQAPATSYHAAEHWNLLSGNGAGGLTIARDGELAVVSPGEWLAAGDDRVLVRRRWRWGEDGFLWATSKRCASLTAERWRVRIYLPGGGIASIREFRAIAGALDRAGFWYEGKVRIGGSRCRDQCVFWLAAGDVVSAYEHFATVIRSDPERVDPPPFTLKVDAVGIAHDPEGRRSLGLAVCGAVVAARDQDSSLDLQARWSLGCEAYELCDEHPWRHPGSIDPFTVWSELEKLAC
jgi:hypothetical protein